jgi:stage III sporulation protein AB
VNISIFINLIGITLTMASTGLIGLYYSNMDGYRISDLLEMKRALSILQSEIEYTETPLAEASLNISQRTRGSVSLLFERLSKLIETNKFDSIYDIWESACLPFFKEVYLSKRDTEQLLTFGNTLGYLDSNMQLKSISQILNYIDEQVAEINAVKAKNKKMYSSAGFLAGALIVVILI